MVCLFACLVLATPVLAAAAPKRIPTHEDIWLMKRVGAPQVSPDGRWIVVSVIEPAYDDNAQLSDLWLIDTTARHSSRRLTSTRRPESGVTWSPDSRRIVFSAQRDNDDAAADLFARPSRRRRSAAPDEPVGRRARHRCSRTTAGSSRSCRSCIRRRADDAANKELIEAHRARKSNARIYDGFPIRSWDRWLDERQARIFVQTLDDGRPRRRARRATCSPARSSRRVRGSPAARPTPAKKSKSNSRPTTRPSCSPRPPIAMQPPMRSPIRSLFVASVKGGEPRADSPQGNDSWSQPRFTPDGRTSARRARSTGRERLQRVAARGVRLARAPASTASSPTASIAR